MNLCTQIGNEIMHVINYMLNMYEFYYPFIFIFLMLDFSHHLLAQLENMYLYIYINISVTYTQAHMWIHVLAFLWQFCPRSQNWMFDLVNSLLLLQITINRPERRNAFRPHTIKELIRAFNDARDDCAVGVIILTGKVYHTVFLWAYVFLI